MEKQSLEMLRFKKNYKETSLRFIVAPDQMLSKIYNVFHGIEGR